MSSEDEGGAASRPAEAAEGIDVTPSPEADAGPPPEVGARAPRFYHEPWVVALVTLMVPPLGIAALIGSPRLSMRAKLATSGGLIFLGLLIAGVEAETHGISRLVSEVRAEALARSANGWMRMGDPARAEAAARQAYALLPWPRYAYEVAEVLRRSGREFSAERGVWLRLAVRPDEPDASRRAAWTVAYGRWLLGEDVRAAPKARRDAVRVVLTMLDGYAGRAAGSAALRAALLRAEGDPRGAEDAARRVLLDFDTDAFADAYEEIARARMQRGDALGAAYFAAESFRHDTERDDLVPFLKEAVEAAGEPWVPWRAFVRACRIRGPLDPDAEEVGSRVGDAMMQKLLERRPRFPGFDLLLHARGSRDFYETKDYEAALASYQEAVREAPRGEVWCRCLYQVARTYEKLEKWPEGVRAARRAARECAGDLAGASRGLAKRIQRKQREEEREG